MTVEISAILTTHNRCHLLPLVLAALERQTLSADRFEVIAVDDGSTDATPELLAGWATRLPLRIQRQKHAGLAAAKNLGVLLSRGPIVVFLDDDDVAHPGLLAAHLAAHIQYPESTTAVLGFTQLAAEVASKPVMRHATTVGCQLFSYGWMRPGQWLGHTEFWGGRSSCKRTLLVQYGLFRPEFTFGCEDIELGWRLAIRGLRVLYEPRAQATMIRSLSFDEFCARSYRQGRSQALFARMHADSAVRAYCEIDHALATWPQRRMAYAAHLRWTRRLDRLAVARADAELPLSADFQQTLDDAYREAFALSRAKGVCDMIASLPAPLSAEYDEGFRPMLRFGLPAQTGGMQT